MWFRSWLALVDTKIHTVPAAFDANKRSFMTIGFCVPIARDLCDIDCHRPELQTGTKIDQNSHDRQSEGTIRIIRARIPGLTTSGKLGYKRPHCGLCNCAQGILACVVHAPTWLKILGVKPSYIYGRVNIPLDTRVPGDD